MGTQIIKILLVEDEEGDIDLIKMMLEEEQTVKFDFTVAKTLNQALIETAENGFDVVLLDLGLPDSWGMETFRYFHEHCENTPVIVLTGLEDREAGIKTVKEGAQDYLIKGKIDGSLLCRSILYSIQRFKLETELKKKVEEIERLNRLLLFGRDYEVQDLKKEVKKLKEEKRRH